MYEVIEGNTQGLADADRFIELLNEPPAAVRDLFDRDSDIYVTRAPGRLDVMGGIADYSGSLVLEMPTAEATFAAVQKSDDERIKIASLLPGGASALEFEMGLADLSSVKGSSYYNEAKKFFRRSAPSHWASYVAGAFFVLRRELGVQFQTGARILIASRIPVGKGVSSSAALEIATMYAVCRSYDLDLDARQIALLCQKVENYMAGAPCGVMDQISVCCGKEHSLISLLCQPAEIHGIIDIPDEVEFWGIDSGVRHSVAGADYAMVRAGAFIGYQIIAQAAGFNVERTNDGRAVVKDDRWHGYLANISPEEYERDFASLIPLTISGDAFLDKYGGTTDHVTTIDRSNIYAVKASTEHAIFESSRVKKFATLLSEELTEKSLEALGQLMFDSHRSYSVCGLTEARTDRIVELVRQNRVDGLFGARITGGGSGGTVAVLARRESRTAIEKILQQFESDTGQRPYLFHGSSPGASTFGHIRLKNR